MCWKGIGPWWEAGGPLTRLACPLGAQSGSSLPILDTLRAGKRIHASRVLSLDPGSFFSLNILQSCTSPILGEGMGREKMGYQDAQLKPPLQTHCLEYIGSVGAGGHLWSPPPPTPTRPFSMVVSGTNEHIRDNASHQRCYPSCLTRLWKVFHKHFTRRSVSKHGHLPTCLQLQARAF